MIKAAAALVKSVVAIAQKCAFLSDRSFSTIALICSSELDRHQYTKLLAISVTIAPRHSFISSPNNGK
jgi:hypothetical protein